MARRAQLRAKLTLDNIQFVRAIKQSMKFAKDLGKQFAAQPIRTTAIAGILAMGRAAAATASAFRGMGSVGRSAVRGIATAIETTAGSLWTMAKVATGVGAVIGVSMLAISDKAIGAAAQIEDMTVGFRVLLHSETAAAQRMKDLVSFAAHTPFMLPQIAAASRTLEVLTHGMLSTGKGLEMVGDIASATNRDFEETAISVGRLFAAIRSGTHTGEALASLQDAGAVSPEARRRIEGMASVNPIKAWQMAEAELNRFSGMMEQKSHTWNGLMSTFHDSVLNAFAMFGKPLIDTLKPSLDQLQQVIFALGPKIGEMGDGFAKAVGQGVGILEEGFMHPSELIDPLKLGLRAAFLESVNVLLAGVKSVSQIFPELSYAFEEAFVGAVEKITGEMMKGFQEATSYLMATMEKALAVWKTVTDGQGLGRAETERDNQTEELGRLVKAKEKMGKTGKEAYVRSERVNPITGRKEITEEKVSAQGLDSRIRQTRGKIDAASAEVASYDTTESITSRQKRINQSGDVAALAQRQIDTGTKRMAAAMNEALTTIEKAADDFHVEDVTDAGTAAAQWMDAVKKMANKGKQDIAQLVTKATQTTTAPSQPEKPPTDATYHGGLTTGHVHGAGEAVTTGAQPLPMYPEQAKRAAEAAKVETQKKQEQIETASKTTKQTTEAVTKTATDTTEKINKSTEDVKKSVENSTRDKSETVSNATTEAVTKTATENTVSRNELTPSNTESKPAFTPPPKWTYTMPQDREEIAAKYGQPSKALKDVVSPNPLSRSEDETTPSGVAPKIDPHDIYAKAAANQKPIQPQDPDKEFEDQVKTSRKVNELVAQREKLPQNDKPARASIQKEIDEASYEASKQSGLASIAEGESKKVQHPGDEQRFPKENKPDAAITELDYQHKQNSHQAHANPYLDSATAEMNAQHGFNLPVEKDNRQEFFAGLKDTQPANSLVAPHGSPLDSPGITTMSGGAEIARQSALGAPGADEWIFGEKHPYSGMGSLKDLGQGGALDRTGSSLQGTMLDKSPQRTVKSLLPIGMRRQADRQGKIASIAAGFMNSGGQWDTNNGGKEGFMGSVRSGDRAAARKYVVQKEKDQSEQNKLNAFQHAIESAFDKYWGSGAK